MNTSPENTVDLSTTEKKIDQIIDEFQSSSDANDERKKWLVILLNLVNKNLDAINRLCLTNKIYIGEQFIEEIKILDIARSESPKKSSISIYAMCTRLLTELRFRSGLSKSDEATLENFFIFAIDTFKDSERSQIIYAAYAMPSSIFYDFLQQNDMKDLINTKSFIRSSIDECKKITKGIEDQQTQCKNLISTLSGIKTEANFVALNLGFENINKSKKEEEKNTQKTVQRLGMALIFMPFLQALFVLINDTSLIKEKIFFLAPALLAIELLILYFYRIALHEQKSVKSQIMQLDLRMTLCQFIQSYSDFAKEAKSKDPSSLEKFESIVFSNIVASDEKIPATLDGLDQIGNIAKSIRGG